MVSDSASYRIKGVIPVDTNVTEPWPQLLLSAGRRFRGPMMTWAVMAGLPILGVGATIALMQPQYMAAATLQTFVVLYGVLTWISHTYFTRSVFVIRKEGERAVVDHQRWWRDDERRIPDALKTWWPAQKRAVAWFYETEEEGKPALAPFDPWAQAIERKDEFVTPADIMGLKATMKSAAKTAKHQSRDNREAVRIGMIVILVCAGLLAVFMAGNKAVDVFTSTGTQPGF